MQIFWSLTAIARSAANRIATQPEEVTAYSWRESVLPPFRLQQPWVSTQGEICLSV
jgi:hypothetical protein